MLSEHSLRYLDSCPRMGQGQGRFASFCAGGSGGLEGSRPGPPSSQGQSQQWDEVSGPGLLFQVQGSVSLGHGHV